MRAPFLLPGAARSLPQGRLASCRRAGQLTPTPSSAAPTGGGDGNGCILPADVAAFVLSAFYSFSNPGNLDADIDCDQQAVPSDVAQFVTNWFEALTNPAFQGCQ